VLRRVRIQKAAVRTSAPLLQRTAKRSMCRLVAAGELI